MSLVLSGTNNQAKAWIVYSVAATVLTVHASYNLTMVRTAAGQYTCTFVNPLNTHLYNIVFSCVYYASWTNSFHGCYWQSRNSFAANHYESNALADVHTTPHHSSFIVI